MPITRPVKVFFLTIVSVLCMTNVAEAENLSITYSEVRKQGSETKSFKENVLLGDDFFSVSNSGFETVYDFKKRRIYKIDHGSKSYTDSSLYAIPAFNVSEFHNRVMLRALLEKAGVTENNAFDLFSIESTFGLTDDKQSSGAKLIEKERSLLLVVGDAPASEIGLSDQQLSESMSRTFSKFLLYENTLHPIIRKRWQETRSIPRKISYQFKNMDKTTTVDLVLESVNEAEAPRTLVPSGHALRFNAKEPLDKIFFDMLNHTSKIEQHDKQWYLDSASQALKNNRLLDAMLLITEYLLQTGDKDTSVEFMRQIAKNKTVDKNFQMYTAGSDFSTEQSAKRSLELLRAIDRTNLQHPYVVDIMIANGEQNFRNNRKAIELMTGVLEKNPYIAGVYKDMGDMFYSEYDTFTAWLCWDVARDLYPNHPMLASASQLEKDFQTRMPEYF